LIKRIDHVAEEMESIGNLNGVWCAQTHTVSDAETAVTRDDLGTRMLSNPARQGCRLIVGQHVNRPTNGQVDQEQAITQRPSVQREVIHPNSAGASLMLNSWFRKRRRRVSGLVGKPAARASRAPASPPARWANANTRPVASSVRRP
jgi:hypothetical protein